MKPSLLIVDDETQILSALRRSLRKEGYEIVTADSSEGALRALENQRFDLIVSDHKMPGMSGLDFLQRAATSQPEAARFLITGWTEEIPSEQMQAHGIRALIPKPWDDGDLKSKLREAVSN